MLDLPAVRGVQVYGLRSVSQRRASTLPVSPNCSQLEATQSPLRSVSSHPLTHSRPSYAYYYYGQGGINAALGVRIPHFICRGSSTHFFQEHDGGRLALAYVRHCKINFKMSSLIRHMY